MSSDFTYRIFILYLPEMKKIHSVLYIKYKVLSNAYDKTGLVNHSTKPQRKEDGSNSQNNFVSSFSVIVHYFPYHKLAQVLHKSWFKMTYITGTINFQSFADSIFSVCRGVSSFCLLCLAENSLCFSVFCFCLELIFLP